jgi:hypothetical protein
VRAPAPRTSAEDLLEIEAHVNDVEVHVNSVGAVILLAPRRLGGRRVVERLTAIADIDMLSRCAREIAQAQPEPARRALVSLLVRHQTTCAADRVVLGGPLDHDGRTRTHASFVGTLTADRLELSLRIAYCGGDSASPDAISISSEDHRWTSQRLEFRRDGTACDVAELPFTRALGRVLEAAIAAPDAKLVFEGTSGELAFDDTLRNELQVVLDAHAALAM